MWEVLIFYSDLESFTHLESMFEQGLRLENEHRRKIKVNSFNKKHE